MSTDTVTAPGVRPRPPRSLSTLRGSFLELALRERFFLYLLLAGFMTAAATFQIPSIAMWVGFVVAGYSVVANDSIQTIGTFIASNRNQRWWVLWLFIGGIFVATIGYSWWAYDGDVTYQRLASKGFETAPTSFSYLQVVAPLFLLILTRLRMPVSTTFLLLTSFSTSPSGIGSVLTKSVLGWVIAFGAAFAIWMVLSKAFDRWFRGEAHPAWRVGQWVTSGFLWCTWIMHDAANIAVYLPRSLDVWHLVAFAGTVFLGLGLLFKMGGERVQQVVDEKSNVVDVRPATVIDLVYAGVLYYFTVQSPVPMSTTWVFVGLLGGRELAMALRKSSNVGVKGALRLMGKDLLFVSIGLAISVIVAVAVNDGFREHLRGMIGG